MNKRDIRDREANLKLLKEYGQLGVWALDKRGRVLFCSFCSLAIKSGDAKRHKRYYHTQCYKKLKPKFKHDKFNTEKPVLSGDLSSN
jgi:hypothetical protein